VSADADEDVFRGRLRILDENVKITVVVEHTSIHEFEFEFVPASASVFGNEPRIRKLCLRILVEELHVGVSRGGVQIEVVFLHILTVVALISSEAEQALLENRVFAVPQSESETDQLVAIGNARDAVLAPAIGTRTSLIMGEIVPRSSTGAIVFPHRSPLPFA